MSKNSTLLEATVEKYNKVKNLSTSDIAELDKNDVASGTFAWQADKGIIYLISFTTVLASICFFSLLLHFQQPINPMNQQKRLHGVMVSTLAS